jgi:hypothetical protein
MKRISLSKRKKSSKKEEIVYLEILDGSLQDLRQIRLKMYLISLFKVFGSV